MRDDVNVLRNAESFLEESTNLFLLSFSVTWI